MAENYEDFYDDDDIYSNNGSNVSLSFDIYTFPEIYTVEILVVEVFLMFIGVLANVSFIYVFYKIEQMRSLTNYFLLNLSISDIIFLTSLTVHHGLSINNDEFESQCIVLAVFLFLPLYCSMFTISLVSSDRYYTVCRPGNNQKIQRKFTTKKYSLIIATWVAATFIAIIYSMKCLNYNVYIGSIIIHNLVFILALALVIICYTLIIKKMLKSERTVTPQLQVRADSRKKQVTKMLIVTTTFFFVCVVPYQFYSLITLFVALEVSVPFALIDYQVEIFHISHILLFVHAAFNAILYMATSSMYRSSFCRAFGCNTISAVVEGETRVDTTNNSKNKVTGMSREKQMSHSGSMKLSSLQVDDYPHLSSSSKLHRSNSSDTSSTFVKSEVYSLKASL